MTDNHDYDINHKYDLEQFINSEVKNYQNGDTDLSKIYRYYYKCLVKIIIEIYEKIDNIKDIDLNEIIKYGTNMVTHIYWFLYGYSLNLKLTMFMTERAVLLFCEFIIMSKNPMLNKEFRFLPNISDAIAFTLKKTIGPLNIKINTKNKKFINELNIYKSSSIDLKNTLQNIVNNIIYNRINKIDVLDITQKYEFKSPFINDKKDITYFLEIVSIIFSNLLYQYNRYPQLYHNTYINISNIGEKDITTEIGNQLLFLTLFIDLYQENKNYRYNTDMLKNKIMSSIYHQDEYIYKDLDELKKIKSTSIYKNIMKELI